MLEFLLKGVLSFVLGDVLGPGLVVAVMLVAAAFFALRGWKMPCYGMLIGAVLVFTFLSGAQLEKKQCDIRVNRLLSTIKDAEERERSRQTQARDEIAALRAKNEELSALAREERDKDVQVQIVEVEKQSTEECSSARYSDDEFNSLWRLIRPRRSERRGD